jgi:photosystem II stability/assembly factor-like uncharacterized protein
MPQLLLLATTEGLVVCEGGPGAWRESHRSLEDQHLTTVIARQGVILAGSRQGVFRSDDRGRTWRSASQGLSIPYVRWLAFHPDISDFEIAGTEPVGIFVSRDGAANWQGRPEIEALRDKHNWFLPYSPEAGCVRGFAFHRARVYAAVEVGGALRSDDNAGSFELVPGSDGNPSLSGPPDPYIYPDVHDIHVHPSSADLVYAPTGGGFYRSTDGGRTWALNYDCYCRAAWVDPNDPEHILLGPADGVDSDGRIEVSRDGGHAWQAASGGLDVPWPDHMVERFVPAGPELLAVLSSGELLASRPGEWSWQPLLAEAGEINAAFCADWD